MARPYHRTYQQTPLTRCQKDRRARRFEAVEAAALAAVANGSRYSMARALAKLQRAGQELPKGHRSSHGKPSWRARFKDAAQALADKMAASP